LRRQATSRPPPLRDYIKVTIGFEALARATGTPPEPVRKFGPRGNPQASNCSQCSATCKSTAGSIWRCGQSRERPPKG
jgi:hypothetical protein